MCVGVVAVLVLQLAAARCAPPQQLRGSLRYAARDALLTPPVVILLPQPRPLGTKAEGQRHAAADAHTDKATDDEDLESVVVEAGPAESVEPAESHGRPQTVLLLPNYARLSIGDVVSAIPFLPIEINVPDAIAWAYGGVSSGVANIISIFGRWPFAPGAAQDPAQLRLGPALPQPLQPLQALLQLRATRRSGLVPLLVLPVVPEVVPLHLPIQV